VKVNQRFAHVMQDGLAGPTTSRLSPDGSHSQGTIGWTEVASHRPVSDGDARLTGIRRRTYRFS